MRKASGVQKFSADCFRCLSHYESDLQLDLYQIIQYQSRGGMPVYNNQLPLDVAYLP